MVDKISKLEHVIGYNAKSSEGYWGVPKSFSPFPAMVTEGLATPYQAVLNSYLDTRYLNIGYNAKSSEGYWGVPKSFSPFPAMVTEGLATPYQAVLNSYLDTRYLNGTYKLEEGRHIKSDDSYVALISKELADKNSQKN